MPKAHLVIGLPGAGKTSFLAALWHIVDRQEVAGSLILEKLQDDRGYVQTIRTAWVGLQEVGRTPGGSISPISMWLKESTAAAAQEIVFPDVSGEAFDAQLVDRVFRSDFAALAREASGVILFIHPAAVTPGERIELAQKVMAGIQPSPKSATDQPGGGWDVSKVPTQAKLVELLQFLDTSSDSNYPISVVISAWDLASKLRLTPAAWLSGNLPLLGQYLAAHEYKHHHKIYGISAVGGSLETETARLKKLRPFERISVDTGDGKPGHDITLPIKWLISAQ